MDEHPKKSALPTILSLLALGTLLGGCLLGSFSSFSYRQSEAVWDLGGLGSEGRRFAGRLEREAQGRADERIGPTALGATCCLIGTALLTVGAAFIGARRGRSSFAPIFPSVLGAFMMLMMSAMLGHAAFFSDKAKQVDRQMDRFERLDADPPGLFEEAYGLNEKRRSLLARSGMSCVLCFGAFFTLGAMVVVPRVARRKRAAAG